MGQHVLPQRNIAVRFTLNQQTCQSRANCAVEPERQRHISSGSSSRLRHRPAPVFPKQIVDCLDHQGLGGRIPVKGELPKRLQSFWINPRQDTPRCRRRARLRCFCLALTPVRHLAASHYPAIYQAGTIAANPVTQAGAPLSCCPSASAPQYIRDISVWIVY
jgi:hypothetical protein